MRIGKKWAGLMTLVVLLVVLSAVVVAWQPPTSHSGVINAMKTQARQSVPAVPFPAVSDPMTDAEYNDIQNYCLGIVVWLKRQQSLAFGEAQTCRERISTHVMSNYYNSRHDWWQEIMDEIEAMDTSTHLIDAEVQSDLEGLAMQMQTAKGYLQAGNVTQAKAVMATAFDKAKNIVALGPNGFNLDMLNSTYDSLAWLWDRIAEDEYNAGIEAAGIELGAHI